MVASLLSATVILIAGSWKWSQAPSFEDWKGRARYMFLMAKLSAVVRHRMGNPNAIRQFCEQWAPCIKHNNHYRLNAPKIRHLLDIIKQ